MKHCKILKVIMFWYLRKDPDSQSIFMQYRRSYKYLMKGCKYV